jgi:O-6-methylguanine DNA methyltransferase
VLREMKAPQGFLDGVLRRCGLVDGYALVDSPLGRVYVASGEHGITTVAEARSDADFERSYNERFGRRAERRDELTPELARALAAGSDAAVDLRGCNPFQRDVLEAARSIHEGEVRPYAWIAREIGKPKAVRAVGTALAHNPVPLVIPCHRVVRSDGTIGEYALGSAEKIHLLEHEGVDIEEVRRRVPRRAYWTEPGTSTYCYPYCFAARPLPEDRIIELRSTSEAHARGLHPCATCHPPLAA